MRDEHQARIGAQIASLREQQGWSQRALAKWVGIDQSAVSRIEGGRRRLSADELQRFAHALHVSADVLLKGAAEAPAVSAGQAMPSPAPLLEAEDSSPVALRGPRYLDSTLSADQDRLRSRDEAWASEAGSDSAEPPFAASPLRTRAPKSRPQHLMPRLSAAAGSAIADRSDTSQYARSEVWAASTGARLPHLVGLPDEVAGVVRDWFALRALAVAPDPAQRWSTGHSAEGKPERVAHTSASPRAGDVLFDRVARFWRSELHVDPDDGPLPDLVPLLEDGYGTQVVVARVGVAADRPVSDRPVAAAFTLAGIPFIFVNAARPVVLQRFALAHAFAHLVLGHGDVLDERVEWSRNVPPEAAANDFAEELLAPVRAVQRWYERKGPSPRSLDTDDLLELGNAFGISAWAALYRSRAAGRLHGRQFQMLKGELERHQWEVLPRQAYLGGLRDTLTHLTPGEALPPREYGGPAVLRVPAAMRAWALAAMRGGRLSLEDTAAMLRLEPAGLEEQLARLGLE